MVYTNSFGAHVWCTPNVHHSFIQKGTDTKCKPTPQTLKKSYMYTKTTPINLCSQSTTPNVYHKLKNSHYTKTASQNLCLESIVYCTNKCTLNVHQQLNCTDHCTAVEWTFSGAVLVHICSIYACIFVHRTITVFCGSIKIRKHGPIMYCISSHVGNIELAVGS